MLTYIYSMHPEVTAYINRIQQWKSEIQQIRTYLLDTGFTEEYKWRAPCYTYKGKNIILIGNFKAHCTISFLKGILLGDHNNLLKLPGENSQSVRMFTFTSLKDILEQEATIKAYCMEAMAIEDEGLKVNKKASTDLEFTEELLHKMKEDAAFKTAFKALTTGRQRGYNLFFSGAKQSATRAARIEKYEQRIKDGFGIHDCVCGHSKKMPNCDGSHKLLEQ